jgi:CheY-like chemotaxis protein
LARILVIDDDEDHRLLLREILGRADHRVEEAKDGAQGLRLFASTRPDVVVTDINMPGMDGHGVIAALRVADAGIPIIAVSGGGAVEKDELLLQAATLGANEVIMKPFEPGQLIAAVGRALAK